MGEEQRPLVLDILMDVRRSWYGRADGKEGVMLHPDLPQTSASS